MLSLVPVILLCQSIRQQSDLGSPFDRVRVLAEMTEKKYQERAAADVHFEKMEFLERYNRVITAMKEFTDAYNATQGNVLPVKKVAAITKAFEALQKTESWRRSMGLTTAGKRSMGNAFVPRESAQLNRDQQ